MTGKISFIMCLIISFFFICSSINLFSQVDSSNVNPNYNGILPSDSNKAIDIRGAISNQNLVIVDGIPTTNNSLFSKKPKLNPVRFGVLMGVTAGAVLFLHNFQRHAWWSGTREQFHIQNDWAYAMSMDKIGHFMEGGLIERTMKGAFIWSGMEERTAMWFGALFSIGYMTDIEIEDGFAKEWGYSPGDEYANLSGDIFAIAQDMWHPLQTVTLKWSYVPTNDPQHKGDFPDDYNGQVFWLSFNVHDYFKGKLQEFWPKYLNLDVGYGVKGYDDYGPGSRTQNIYLGLDFDMRRIIPGDSKFMKFVKDFLNTFKIIPTPAIKWNTSNGKIEFVVH
jgi:hypothetical protein